MKHFAPALQLLPAAACVVAWLPPVWLWQWKISLLILEMGHWLALLTLGLGIHALSRQRRFMAVFAFFLTAALLAPATLALCMDKEVSLMRLYLPKGTDVKVERREFWHSDDEALDVVIYRPGKPSGTPLPCIVVLHGGGWENGDPAEFEAANQAISSRGIAMLSFGYRLAPKHPWMAQKEDIKAAMQWTRDHASELQINPDNIYLMGRSAGGQIATACGFSMPELKVRGCIAIYSPHDLVFAHRYSREDDILNALKLLRQYMGGDPANAADNYASASAYTMVTPQSPPTLLIHGTRDALVWVLQSRRLAQKLKEAGVRHEFIELPWAVHGLDYFPSSPSGQIAIEAVSKFVLEPAPIKE